MIITKEVFDNGGVSLLHITNSNTIYARIYGFNPTYCKYIASAINSENLSEKYADKTNIIVKFANIIKNDISNKFGGTAKNVNRLPVSEITFDKLCSFR